MRFFSAVTCAMVVLLGLQSIADEKTPQDRIVLKPGLYKPITEPPCSYCSTQHLKGFIQNSDRVVAWLRASHNGGAVPVRHFLAGPRVINDTYGLFFYDPDGGYVAAYQKDYGYSFHGWKNGVMIVKGPDGSLWSALSGVCFEGAKKGQRLKRIPSLVTDWGYWMMLHPESTAYDLFDGKRYSVTPLPEKLSQEAKQTMGEVDTRLKPNVTVMGIEVGERRKAYPLNEPEQRACFNDSLGDQKVAVFWYRATRTAVAFSRELDGTTLTFYADPVSPESAPIKDRETGTRWTLAGRAVDGPLRGKELRWINSIQCRWYAWAAEFPRTEIYVPSK